MALDNSHPELTRFGQLLKDVGASALHYLYPQDFETYMCALELVNSAGDAVDYFVFPVMPNSIKQGERSIMNIQKTAGGIVVTENEGFNPISIAINGNFGKNFKFLIGRSEVNASAIRFSTGGVLSRGEGIRMGAIQLKNAVYNTQIKTGYGCIKVLQAIVRQSRSTDEQGNAYQLFFYNPAMGESFLVKVENLELELDKDQKNMIHHYTLQMQAIAPITGVRSGNGKDTLLKTMEYDNLAKAGTMIVNKLKSELSKVI